MGQVIPVASKIKVCRKMIPFCDCSPVFDTTPPGVGGLTETAPKARHGNFTPPRFSPSCPRAGVSLCTDGVIAKQLVPLFCGRMGTARRLHWPSLMQGACTGGSWRILQCRWAVRERISVPDMTERARCFSRCGGEGKTPPHCVGSERAFFMLFFQKFLKKFFILLIFLDMTD